MPAARRQAYSLDEVEHDRIFQEDIKPYLMGSAMTELRPSPHPVLVIVAGQPGAGKSRSMDSVRLDLEGEGGVLEISADDLRKFHPAYASLMLKDDRLAADHTHQDAALWAQKAEAFARSERFNVLFEATLKTPESAVRKLAEYRAADYFVELRVIAVDARSSWQGVLGRYEQQKAQVGVGRMTPKTVHDAAVEGVLLSVERIENEGLADRVRIDRRGAEQIYTNSLMRDEPDTGALFEDGRSDARIRWSHPPQARTVIEAERSRLWTSAQWDEHVAGFDRISGLQRRDGRVATPEQLQEVAALRAAAALERDRAVLREHHAEVAKSFAVDTPALAIAKHPRLAGAYKVLDLVDAQAQAAGLGQADLGAVRERTKHHLGLCIAAGDFPPITARLASTAQVADKPLRAEAEPRQERSR